MNASPCYVWGQHSVLSLSLAATLFSFIYIFIVVDRIPVWWPHLLRIDFGIVTFVFYSFLALCICSMYVCVCSLRSMIVNWSDWFCKYRPQFIYKTFKCAPVYFFPFPSICRLLSSGATVKQHLCFCTKEQDKVSDSECRNDRFDQNDTTILMVKCHPRNYNLIFFPLFLLRILQHKWLLWRCKHSICCHLMHKMHLCMRQ